MTNVYEFEGVIPVIDTSSFVHPDAVIIGDVIIGPECYIGPSACLRGDFGRITIGKGSNIQDTCVIHSFPGQDAAVEENVHVGHGAVLHGCLIKKNAMIGIRAVVLDGAVVGENAFVGAMSFVASKFKVPGNVLVAGVPAKVVKDLSEDEIEIKSFGTSLYQRLAVRSKNTMKSIQPLKKINLERERIKW